MIKSMTAFGRAKRENETKSVTVEIKSVNSRFFDCNVKLPRAYLALEERIRSYFPIVDVTAQGRYAVHFYVGAIMASFKYWVDGEFEETAEQIAEIISNLIGKENAISLMVFPEN